MAQHVYLSEDAVLASSDDPPASSRMRYRGEAGPGDDVASFREKMAAAGHLVIVTAEHVGDAVTLKALGG